MLNGNLILLLLSVIAVFALGMDSKNKKSLKEGFTVGMPQLATYVQPINANTMTDVKSSPLSNMAIYGSGITNPTLPRLGADMRGTFVTTPAYQCNLSPRMMPIQLPSNIRYRMPSQDNLAVPKNPLGYPNSLPGGSVSAPATAKDFSKMACKENYGAGKTKGNGNGNGNGKESYCGASAYGEVLPPNYKPNQAEYNKLANELNKVTLTDFTPNMDMTTMTATGEQEQVRVLNRLVYGVKKDRNLRNADPIRGDLPIVPCQTGWFQVSTNPVTMLNPGAMAVMGGTPGDLTTANLWRLQNAASGNSGQFASSISGLGFDPIGSSSSKMTLEKSLGIDSSEGVNVVTSYGQIANTTNTNPPFLVTSFP